MFTRDEIRRVDEEPRDRHLGGTNRRIGEPVAFITPRKFRNERERLIKISHIRGEQGAIADLHHVVIEIQKRGAVVSGLDSILSVLGKPKPRRKDRIILMPEIKRSSNIKIL